jgi:hypothetical protein
MEREDGSSIAELSLSQIKMCVEEKYNKEIRNHKCARLLLKFQWHTVHQTCAAILFHSLSLSPLSLPLFLDTRQTNKKQDPFIFSLPSTTNQQKKKTLALVCVALSHFFFKQQK